MLPEPDSRYVFRVVAWVAAAICLNACGGSAPARESTPISSESSRPGGFARLSNLDEGAPRGDLEGGRAGDWVLENDRLRVVVSAVGHRGCFSEGGGNILDAAPAGGPDLLREIFTYFDDTFPRQALYTEVGPGPAVPGGGVTLIARGKDSENPVLEVETVYLLEPRSEFLEIRSTLRNTGADTVKDFELGDAIEWGRATAFGPGVGENLEDSRPVLPFLLGYGEGACYAWVSPEGDLQGPHGEPWSDPIVKVADLIPGGSAVYVRRLIVTPDVAEAAGLAWRARGTELGELSVSLKGDGAVRAGWARFSVRVAGGGPILGGYLTEDGSTRLSLPPGEVTLEVRHPSRGFRSSDEVRVSEGKRSSVSLELPEPATLHLSAVDGTGAPSPARWTFEGTGKTPTPEFGPRYALAGAGPYHFTPTGKATVEVPPGQYRVTVTRGPAYEAWIADLDLDPGQSATLDATLPRLDLPPQWVSADFHVHAVPSFDSPVSLADRVGSLVCEGVDWFAASDHAKRTDYAPVLEGLELAATLHCLLSEEITTSKLGHFGAFPVPYRGEAEGNGAVIPDGLSADEIFDRLRGEGENVLIQVNHPRSGGNGYFDQFEYSASDDTAAAGFRRDFDLLEILNGKTNGDLEEIWADWMALLRGEDPVTGVGNSDSHWVLGQEVGVPRNYVRIDPGGTGPPEARFVEAVRTGCVVVTNGPFVEFTLGGVGVGGTASASEGQIRGHIRVIAPSWVDVRRVRVYLNGREQTTYMVQGNRDAVRFDEDVEIPIHRPSFVVVRVEGDVPMDPVVPAARIGNRLIPVRPIAITNPIWVETKRSR